MAEFSQNVLRNCKQVAKSLGKTMDGNMKHVAASFFVGWDSSHLEVEGVQASQIVPSRRNVSGRPFGPRPELLWRQDGRRPGRWEDAFLSQQNRKQPRIGWSMTMMMMMMVIDDFI